MTDKNLLYKTKCYLVGHMQYVSGRNWRDQVAEKLKPLSITCFDPYKKPFIKDVEEDEYEIVGNKQVSCMYPETGNRFKISTK